MCGIAGFLALRPSGCGFSPEPRLRGMIATVRHRGPDDAGTWSDGLCGLAHARLAVIDLSPGGHQPMSDEAGRFWVTFNGEIYNFLDLRRELEGLGHRFRSQSDTEVLIHGYAAWGPAVVDRLRGMFAFALWDRTQRSLLLVRDRLGKKPLYWSQIGDILVFGSEIKSILTWPGVDRSPDRAAIDEYLSLQYIPAPRTAFAGIQKLPAAHRLIVRVGRDGRCSVGRPERYWALPAPTAPKTKASARVLAGELVERLTEAIKLRLISDVPLGAFLSGGVDSSAIVALMSRLGAAPVKTFTIGFPDPRFDETQYARMVAQRYSTDHEELIVEPDAARIIPRLVWHYGEPFADPSMVPTYLVSELARRKVTVALNGDGGDEAFFGYDRYAICRNIERLGRLPQSLRRLAARGIGILPRTIHRRYGQRLGTLADLLTDADGRRSQRYALTIAFFLDQQKRDGYAPEMQEFLTGSGLDRLDTRLDEAPTLVSGANWTDLHTYLPDDLMVKVDVASMAHALESRSPLLDHVFLEWAATLPMSVQMARGRTKALFKKAMEPYLPHAILYRKKMGFACPVGQWLRSELRDMTYDLLLSASAVSRGFFRRDYLERLLREHMSGSLSHDSRLWALLILELWFRMWIDPPVESALAQPALTA